MSTDPNKSPGESPASHTFSTKAVAFIAATAFIAWGLAMVAMPIAQGAAEGLSAYDALCRAIGLTSASVPAAENSARPSNLSWNASMLARIAAGDAARGAQIAEEVCLSCHFVNGETADRTTQPSISGQSARAIYKQLWDIKTGARVSEIMQPIAAALDEAQMADVAAYYAGLVRRNRNNPEAIAVAASTVDLVLNGDAARALPPCAACHADRAGGPLETPALTGQYYWYTEAQLRAFADGTRRNDRYARMREIARKLTAGEIAELSAYYNAPPAR